MRTKSTIHTVAKNGRWMNIREGAERGGKMFDTNTAAEAAGRATAQLDQVEHVIHEPDGTICGRTSYGKGWAQPTG